MNVTMKRVILFGAGICGKAFIKKNRDFVYKNFSFCDNAPRKVGKEYEGLSIISFYEMKQLYIQGKISRIIITTAKAMEILEQCICNEISIEDIYFYNDASNAIIPAKDIYSMTVFSQGGEEIYLREKFANKKDGIYVDVGALHPFRFSNTAWAYETGWRGINIEPNVDQFHLFETFRPMDINVNCGVANKEGELTYYCYEEPALNGFDTELHKDIPIVEKRNVKIRKLSNILKEYDVTRVDFLDIDVEGLEMEVLKSIDFSVNIECILVEQHVSLALLMKSPEYLFLKEKGYEAVAKYGITTVYERITNM